MPPYTPELLLVVLELLDSLDSCTELEEDELLDDLTSPAVLLDVLVVVLLVLVLVLELPLDVLVLVELLDPLVLDELLLLTSVSQPHMAMRPAIALLPGFVMRRMSPVVAATAYAVRSLRLMSHMPGPTVTYEPTSFIHDANAPAPYPPSRSTSASSAESLNRMIPRTLLNASESPNTVLSVLPLRSMSLFALAARLNDVT
jgi:hypothetical protein